MSLSRSKEITFKEAHYFYDTACNFQEQRRLDEALNNFQKVLVYDGNPDIQNIVISSYYHISLIYYILQEFGESRKYALKCLGCSPNHHVARLLLDMPQEAFWKIENDAKYLFVLEDVPLWERLVRELLKYSKGVSYNIDVLRYLSQVYCDSESYKGRYDPFFLDSVSPYAISFIENLLDVKQVQTIYFWGMDQKTHPKDLLIAVALARGRRFEWYPGA